jgi:hypothetical protein
LSLYLFSEGILTVVMTINIVFGAMVIIIFTQEVLAIVYVLNSAVFFLVKARFILAQVNVSDGQVVPSIPPKLLTSVIKIYSCYRALADVYLITIEYSWNTIGFSFDPFCFLPILISTQFVMFIVLARH